MSRLLPFATAVLLLAICPSSHANDLDGAAFKSGLDGRTLFVVFHAPWCGHCKALMPAWKTVAKEVADNASINKFATMGRVDCTDDGNKALCSTYKIEGFPTIMYGSVDNLETYQGGRDEESLRKFASELRPRCGVGHEENCSDDETKALKELQKLDKTELQKRIDAHADESAKIEKTFEAAVKELQNTYEQLTEKKKKDIETLGANSNNGLVKSVLRHKKKEQDDL